MLCAPKRGFVLLSLPKAGSTTLVEALTPTSQIIFRDPPQLKHTTARNFHRRVRPLLESVGYERDNYELVTMFREPVQWLNSWYRYRCRAQLRGSRNYAGELTFPEFTEAYLVGWQVRNQGPAAVGRPARFISADGGTVVGVDRIFSLDRPEVWQEWFRTRVGGRVEFGRSNRSDRAAEKAGPQLPPELDARLREFFAPEYAVWDRLAATGVWAGARGTDLAAE